MVLESIPVTDDSPGVARFYQFSPSGGYGAACDSYDHYNIGEWQYEQAMCDATSSTSGQANQYLNDRRHSVGVTTWKEYGVNYQNTVAPLNIGTSMFEVTDDFNNCWYGKIDEIQISSVSRSQAWEKASYWTGKDQLLTINGNMSNVKPAPTKETAPIASFSASPTSGKYPQK